MALDVPKLMKLYQMHNLLSN